MNASLQCIASVAPLTEYFTTGKFISDLNLGEKFGSKNAELAEAYHRIVNELWAPKSSLGRAHAPRQFKRIFGRFKRDFSGFTQEDAPEFLNSLIDGLHEDLNRVKEKPYAAQPDSDGRPDEVVACEWWDAHKRRENSIVDKLFAGQYKCLITCETCGHQSARFEPFRMFTVPLPKDDDVTVTGVFVPFDRSSALLKFSVRLNRDNGKIDDLKAKLVELLPKQNLSKANLYLAHAYECKIISAIGDDEPIHSLIGSTTLHCFQIRCTTESPRGGPGKDGDEKKKKKKKKKKKRPLLWKAATYFYKALLDHAGQAKLSVYAAQKSSAFSMFSLMTVCFSKRLQDPKSLFVRHIL